MLLKDNLIEKSNILNTLRCGNMGLTELRFFCLYLSKLNARNPEKRTIQMSIAEFEELFDVKFNSTMFNYKIEKIMSRTVKIKENNDIRIIALYSEFRWNSKNYKTLNVTCNYDIVPYLFELKKNYTKYMIENIVKLDSVQKIRLYEILKQYEKLGMIKFNIVDLQEMMCCAIREFKFFKRDTLTPAIRDINQYTDIQVSYEKNLSCRKVVALTFTIDKKKIFSADNVDEQSVDTTIQSLYYRCKEEYTIKQLEQLYGYVSNCGINISSDIDNYIYSIYANIKISGNKINNLFKYTLSIIKDDINKHMFEDSKNNSNSHTSRSDEMYISSYDINEVVRNHKVELYTQEKLENENIKPIELSKVEEVYSSVDIPSNKEEKKLDFQILEFKFFYDDVENSFVSFTSCSRLQALLEKKYHKEDTYWLLEEPFTQEQVINLIFKRHQVVVVPKPVGDFSDFQQHNKIIF